MTLVVVQPGIQTLVEDLGRAGQASAGVGTSGAADRRSAALANACVGNHRTAAVLEVLLGRLVIRALHPCLVAVTGASGPLTIDGADADPGVPLRLHRGQELTLGVATTGLRRYLAVRGGIDAPRTLGSRSSDVLAGLGPAPVVTGQVLSPGLLAAFDPRPVALPTSATHATYHDGPRLDRLDEASRTRLDGSRWTVSPTSNRTAVRLLGTPLTLSRPDELPSEGILPGAIQVPPNGEPLIFLADHPATGGYPVVGVLDADGLAAAAQWRPGVEIGLGREARGQTISL